MFAKLLADSGGADEIVDTIVGHASPRMLPWAMALVGSIIGLPMFFEIGPGAADAGHLSGRPALRALPRDGRDPGAGRAFGHARFVPPHPGPLTAVGLLNADLGLTLVSVCWWRFRRSWWRARCSGSWRAGGSPSGAGHLRRRRFADSGTAGVGAEHRRPSVVRADPVRRPPAGRADDGQGDRRHRHQDESQVFRKVFDSLGTPVIALLLAVIVEC